MEKEEIPSKKLMMKMLTYFERMFIKLKTLEKELNVSLR